MFHELEVYVIIDENAEITNSVYPGFTMSFLDQHGWTWNKSTGLQLVNFPSSAQFFSVNKLLQLF